MSVHTPLSEAQIKTIMGQYGLLPLKHFEGIYEGVTNTIYRINACEKDYVLTLFETLTEKDLPFYMALLSFLKTHDFPCAKVMVDKAGNIIQTILSKPAVLMSFIEGAPIETPNAIHAAFVGDALGRLHQLTQSFELKYPNPRGEQWRTHILKKIAPLLSEEDSALMRDEMAFHQQNTLDHLPKGIIHCDLFRDNVIFKNDQLTGIIDFYYACYAPFLLDVAIAANDWCVGEGTLWHETREKALLAAYEKIRPLTQAEKASWSIACRWGAFRFWLSRCHDFYCVPDRDIVHKKDPHHFKALLCFHRKARNYFL